MGDGFSSYACGASGSRVDRASTMGDIEPMLSSYFHSDIEQSFTF